MSIEQISILGGISGFIGAIGSIWAVMTVHSFKSQDLRLKRQNLIDQITHTIEEIISKIPQANKSRERRLAAQGLYNSGMKIKWDTEIEDIRNEINKYEKELNTLRNKNLLFLNLEKNINALNLIEIKVTTISKKLNEALLEDIKEVDSMRLERNSQPNPSPSLRGGA